jgi:hypothetical protein
MASTPAKNTKIYTEDLVVEAARGSSTYNRTVSSRELASNSLLLKVRIQRRKKRNRKQLDATVDLGGSNYGRINIYIHNLQGGAKTPEN